MTKACLLLCALLVVAAVCTPVFGARYRTALDSGKWVDKDGICTYDRDTVWRYGNDGADVEELLEAKPPGQLDPRIRQNVLNASEDTWTDWHVSITNATNLRGVSVYKVGEGTPWVIEPYTTEVGFFAHVISVGPGNPMAVNPTETLYVEFTYDVAVAGQPVTVTQYPTTWYPIPEPSSILALLVGVGSLGVIRGRR